MGDSRERARRKHESLGVHQAYYDKSTTLGVKVTSYAGTADLMSYYPETLKEWISRHGGLTTSNSSR